MHHLHTMIGRLDAYIDQRLRDTRTPGFAIALTDRQRLLHVGSYGLADLATRQPVTPETLFQIGSIGKSFTAIGLLQEHAAGRLDLHTPITQYLPWFNVRSEFAPITAHHLLSHTSGLPSGTDFAADSRYEVLALREQTTGSAPGEHFYYSNVGYKLLGWLLETLTGQPYARVLHERILMPLEMRASTPTITNAARERMATGYLPYHDDRPSVRRLPLSAAPWFEYGMGDGSPACTPADLAAYLRMLLNRGQGDQQRILDEASFDLLCQRATTAWTDQMFYGYGIVTELVDGRVRIGHAGEMVGYHAVILGDVAAGLGVVVLTNGPETGQVEASWVLDLLRASSEQATLPELPPPASPATTITSPTEYAGTYRSADKTWTLVARDEQLVLEYGASRTALEQISPGAFKVDHPDFDRFVLSFGRDESGAVVEAFNGGDWFIGERYSGPQSFSYPAEWDALVGHYRSYNPWWSSFRVVVRKGALYIIIGFGWRRPLVPLGDGVFRVDAEEWSPERLRFDTIVELHGAPAAMRADLSGCAYYRVASP